MASTVAVPDVIIIPVVVHVVYNNADQNISNDQVRSQIKVLNEDFRKKNKDAAFVPSAFKNLAADARIEFRLATVDPSGFTTNGIIRTSTGVTGFVQDDKIKSTAVNHIQYYSVAFARWLQRERLAEFDD